MDFQPGGNINPRTQTHEQVQRVVPTSSNQLDLAPSSSQQKNNQSCIHPNLAISQPDNTHIRAILAHPTVVTNLGILTESANLVHLTAVSNLTTPTAVPNLAHLIAIPNMVLHTAVYNLLPSL